MYFIQDTGLILVILVLMENQVLGIFLNMGFPWGKDENHGSLLELIISFNEVTN